MVPWWCDMEIELSRLEREAITRVRARMASEQLGEAFADRRAPESPLRGGERRLTRS